MKHRIAALSALFTIFVFIIPSSTQKAHAAAWFLNDPQSFGQTLQNAEQSNQVQKEGYDFSTQVNMMNTITCLIGGCSSNPQSSLHYSKSALAGINTYISAMYTTPAASTYVAIQDIGHSLGFIPTPVYAQGVGFSGLAPLLPIWKVFRNISYVLLAMVMIVVGFMVMFRRKIDPKTVVTIQNALPRIVITLLLITFSYAIVGLMIDLMYVILAIVMALFKTTGYLPDTRSVLIVGQQSTRDVILSGNLIQIFYLIFPLGGFDLFSLSSVLLGVNPQAIGQLNPLEVLKGILLGIPSAFLAFLLSLSLLFLFIRLFILFLTTYVNIILALLFGPIQILVGAVPGVDGFEGWIKNLIGDIAVFPIAGIMFMLAIVFSEIANKSTGSLWTPPYFTLGNPGASAIAALFVIGILMIIPKMAISLKQALKAKAPVSLGGGQIFGLFAGGTQMLFTHWIQQRSMERAMQRSEDAKTRAAAQQGPSKAP